MIAMFADVMAPLERLYQVLLGASIGGAIVIVAIAIACRVTSRLTPRLRCTIWWLAALKLVIALVWVEPVVLHVLPFSGQPSASASGSIVAGMKSGPPAFTRESAIDATDADPPATVASWRALAAAAWIVGAALGLGILIFRVRRTARIVATARQVEPSIRLTVRELSARVGVRRAVDVRRSSDVSAPMIAGLLQPVILLPSDRLETWSPDEQRMALCHELVHLRRGDLWLGCVPALAERLFFFHPLAILAAREYLLAREAACDRAVIELLDAAPQEYGRLLLSLGVSPMRAGFAAAGSSRSFSNLKRRIAMLGHRSPSSLARVAGWLIAGAALAALVPVHLAARPSSTSPKLLPKHLKAWPWAAQAENASSNASVAAATLVSDEQNVKSEPGRGGKLEYVLVNRDRRGVTMSGEWQDADRLKRKYGDERLLWFRHNGQTYVVRDSAALDEAEQINRPVAIIGAKQGEVGAKQGAVGAKQGAVGAKQGMIGAKQGAIGAKQGQIGAQEAVLAAKQTARLSDSEQRQIDAEHERLAKEMASLNEEMAKLSEEMQRASEPMSEYDDEMRQLSKEMEGLNGEMAAATEKATREMAALFERLINQGVAQAEP